MLCVLLLVAAIMYITLPYMPSHFERLYMSVDSLWLTFVYKSILGPIGPILLPTYLGLHMCRNFSRYGLHSQDIIQMQVLRVKTELGKKAFKFSAPSTWNDVQKDLKLKHLVALTDFKTIIKDREISSIGSFYCTV